MRETRVGTMVTLVSDRQRMVPIKVANFLTRVCILTVSFRTKNHVFWAGDVRFEGNSWEKKCFDLFFFCISTCLSSTQIHHHFLIKSHTVDRPHKLLFLVPTLGQNPFDSFCGVFTAVREDNDSILFLFTHSEWQQFTAPSVASLFARVGGKIDLFFFFSFFLFSFEGKGSD